MFDLEFERPLADFPTFEHKGWLNVESFIKVLETKPFFGGVQYLTVNEGSAALLLSAKYIALSTWDVGAVKSRACRKCCSG